MGDNPVTSRAGSSNGISAGRGRGNARRGNRSWRPYPRRNANHILPSVRPTVFPIPEQQNLSNEFSSSAGSSTVGPCNLDPPTSVFLDERPSFLGWRLYFPGEDYKTSATILRKVKAFQTHYDDSSALYDMETIRTKRYFPLSLQALTNDEKFINNWTSFMQDLCENPETTLCCASLAMYQKVFDKSSSQPSSSLGQISTNSFLQVIRARIQGYGPVVTLRSIRVNNYGRLVAVRGTVIRAAAPEILCTWMAFRCSSCNKQQAVMQPEGIMTIPTSCKDGCRARSNFVPLLSSPYTRTELYQLIRLQESTVGDQYDPGHVPKNIDVELTEDLVDSVCPGDDVTIIGVSRVKPQDDVQRRDQASLYKTFMRATSISSNKNAITNRKSEFTEKDLEGIKMISEEPCPFRLLIHSLCPDIYGHEIVKGGLLLGLFGGSSLNTTRRNETHVLVVGDPGLGKSQMLQSCANVSPRGIFVCGNSSSSVGLTATVRQEKGCGRGGTLEAGALVLADQGACCIDEFDKMTSNHHALLEVMEQQTVSVAKAGVLCSLPARTSVLAAANPARGHYDRSRTISENLKMSPALLSRFDLVFILLDRPDEQLDSLLTSHIQALYSNDKRNSSSSSSQNNRTKKSAIIMSSQDPAKQLKERLKLAKNEKLDLLPHVLMQKYIAYARKHIHPKINSEAAEELKHFYLELRKECSGVDAIPVTTRQLEALIRLTQARARLELANEANRQHALDVIFIVRYSLIDVFTNEDGTLDLDRSINGSGMSQATQVRKFVRLLENRARALNKTVFHGNELKDIAHGGLLTMSFSQLVDSLNIQGILLKKGTNLYKLLID